MRIMSAHLRATREDLDLPEDLYDGVHGALSYDTVGRLLVIEKDGQTHVVPFEHVLKMRLKPEPA